jgi:DNA-binding protein H-NS
VETWSEFINAPKERRDTLDDIPSLEEQIRTLANIKIEPESDSESEDWDRDAALGLAPRDRKPKCQSNNSDSTTWSGIYVIPKDIEDWSQCGEENGEDQFFSLKTLSTTSEQNQTEVKANMTDEDNRKKKEEIKVI